MTLASSDMPAQPRSFPDGLKPAARGTAKNYPFLRSTMALILREMSTRFGRTPGGYIWAIIQPLTLILILAFAFSLLMRTPSLGTSFILFKGTGMLAFNMFKTNATMVAKSLNTASSLLEYPRIAWIDAIIARFALNVLIGLIVAWIILTGILIYEDIRTVLDWSKILTALGLAALLALGVGTLNIFMFMRFPAYETAWKILTAPLMIISGVIMLYEELPTIAQDVLWYNPVMHVTAIMREGFYPMYHPEFVSLIYVLVWALVPMVLGLLLVRRHHRDLLNR